MVDEIEPDDEPLDPDNASDPIAIEIKARKQRITQKGQAAAVGALLKTPDGRAWLANILFGPGLLQTPTMNAAFDPYAMAWRDGARSLALTIQKEALRMCPEAYMVLLREHMPKG
jgi:hypothetical protein